MVVSTDETARRKPAKFQVVLVGANQKRVAKVTSLLPSPLLGDDGDDADVDAEVLPCVAKFDSYENSDGESVRYLASVEYHGPDGRRVRGSAIAPILDAAAAAAAEHDDDDDVERWGVVGVAVGCGVYGKDDSERLRAFFARILADDDLVVERARPDTDRFADMAAEDEAYRSLDAKEKGIAAREGTIGPAKTAAFVRDVARECARRRRRPTTTPPPFSNDDADAKKKNPSVDDETTTDFDEPDDDAASSSPADEIGDDDDYYACRACRAPLFAERRLENPPHRASTHSFGRRRGGGGGGACRVVFWSSDDDPPSWSGDDDARSAAVEGRLACPKCSSKVGAWNWSGAQCSCGTWVTPAVWFPLSKVEKVPSRRAQEESRSRLAETQAPPFFPVATPTTTTTTTNI